ncbi:MAG: hypothetical protein IJM84_03660 [Bacteroidaceae bacterium]|nr:hypothetical protein [Bacteroidaceae bacterium]
MTKRSWLITVCISMLVAVSCSKEPPHSILPQGADLQCGDIVLREGTSIESHAVMMGGGAYSHVGIVVDSAGQLMIVHAVPGEADFDGDPARVKLDKPETFFLSDRATSGEVRRYHDANIAQRAARHAYAIYKRRTLFDNDYNDRDTTQMYCSEMVEYVYKCERTDVCDSQKHDYQLPGFMHDGVRIPYDFAESKKLKTIIKF